MIMIDAHCHIDLFPDPLAVAVEAERDDIVTIAVTNLPSHFQIGYPHIRGLRRIRLALGLHPLMADKHHSELELFKTLASKTSYIGEIGLDFSETGKATKDEQIDSFRFVLRAINDRPRFISLHSRRAESAVLEVLDEFGIACTVFHWYTGPLNTLDQIIEKGHYFSVNSAMVNSKTGKKIVERIPRNRILTESDGPYVQLHGVPARPKDMKKVLSALKNIWGISIEQAESQVSDNFKVLVSRL